MKLFLILCVLCLSTIASTQLVSPRILSQVLKSPQILQKPSSNIMITLKNPLDSILDDVGSKVFPTRQAKLAEVRRRLQTATGQWHAPVLAALQPFGVETKSYWITNRIFVKNANPNLITLLLTTLLGLLKSVSEEINLPIMPIIETVAAAPPTGPEWGVLKIGAPDIWNLTKGAGVVVGITDTGVQRDHEAIADNYVGADKNGWFDPILHSPVPFDDFGHGTHCAGTICGNNGIGVAPEAKWMACRACTPANCAESDLLTCGEFMACPTDPQGQNDNNCAFAPNIVSNSWGGDGGLTFYNDIIKTWNLGRIIPVFAIGNAGPNCGTAGSPGDQDGVISIGATNINDVVSTFSSRGPRKANDGVVRPQIAAPGESIKSSYILGPFSYAVMSGTSMATPHTAGAIALLVSKKSDLTRTEVENLLYPTAFRGLGPSGTNCGQNTESVYPNDVAGYGRLDIKAALNKLTSTT